MKIYKRLRACHNYALIEMIYYTMNRYEALRVCLFVVVVVFVVVFVVVVVMNGGGGIIIYGMYNDICKFIF